MQQYEACPASVVLNGVHPQVKLTEQVTLDAILVRHVRFCLAALWCAL